MSSWDGGLQSKLRVCGAIKQWVDDFVKKEHLAVSLLSVMQGVLSAAASHWTSELKPSTHENGLLGAGHFMV